jgi:hypothetical protein
LRSDIETDVFDAVGADGGVELVALGEGLEPLLFNLLATLF